MQATQPILILSTGRTGTKFLATLLKAHFSKLACIQHESRYTRPINILTNMHFASWVAPKWVVITWKWLKRHELEQTKKEFYIDINNFLYGIPTICPSLYPGLKVIHIIRDPRDYVRSHLNWVNQRAKSFIANHLIPFWQPSPFFSRESKPGGRLGLSTFERFCWIWNFKNTLLESIRQSSTPYLCLKFEDFFQSPSPIKELNEMVEFIGLPAFKAGHLSLGDPENVTVDLKVPAWRGWEPALCAQLDSFCGTTMKKYGYGYEPEWINNVRAGQNALRR